MRALHFEKPRTDRIGGLRAAVPGANAGIVSTASLVVGVAAAHAASSDILVTGVAGLVAGAMSMAAGKYVSVSSQVDTESAGRIRELAELIADPDGMRDELAAFYTKRGLDEALAQKVAEQLMAHDALSAGSHIELRISGINAARPLQAALASAATFAAGAALPLVMVLVAPAGSLIPAVIVTSILCLAVLGGLGAPTGGARASLAALRVIIWGAAAMALTAGVGAIFGAAV